jgi:hypothetical protein
VSIFAEAPVPAPQLLAYAQALGPIFVGLGTLAVSFMTYLLARRQRELAEQQQQIAADKLATDLFDRRLAAIRGAAKAADDWSSQIRNSTKVDEVVFRKPAQDEFDRVARDLPFLFGDEVVERMAGLEAALGELQDAQIDLASEVLDQVRPRSPNTSPIIRRARNASVAVARALSELHFVAKPYMFLGKIAVAEPSSTTSVKASELA